MLSQPKRQPVVSMQAPSHGFCGPLEEHAPVSLLQLYLICLWHPGNRPAGLAKQMQPSTSDSDEKLHVESATTGMQRVRGIQQP